MTPQVFTIVAASSDCTQLLGSPPNMRFYRFGEAPQESSAPYATWQMPSAVPANYLGQIPDIDEQRIQIDVWAKTQLTAEQLADAIREAVQEYAQETNASQRPRDATTRMFGFMLEFQFFTPR